MESHPYFLVKLNKVVEADPVKTGPAPGTIL